MYGEWVGGRLQGRPGTADTSGHVSKVKDEETMVVGSIAADADALTTAAASDIGVVDAHVDRGVARGGDIAIALGGGFIDVVDEAIGRVSAGEESEAIEEAIARVIVL